MQQRLLRVVNLLVAAGLGAAVVVTSRPWEVWRLDAGFLGAFAVALLLDLALVVVWSHRHALVLAAVGSVIAPRRLRWLVTFSNTANNLTPAASGEVGRAWFLNRRFGVPVEQAGAAIVFERVFMFGLMAVTALTAGLLATGATLPAGVAVLGVAGYLLAVPAVLRPLARRRHAASPGGGRIRRLVAGILTGGLRLWSDHAVAVKTAAWSVLAFGAQALVFLLAASVSGLDLGAAEVWALVGGATTVGVLSALPFGLGAAELSAVGIGVLLGLPRQEVASAFVLYRIFFTFPLALAGSVAYARLTGTAQHP